MEDHMADGTSFFENFMPHGMCYLWRSDILLLNVISDALIAVSYFFIPFALYYFLRRRTDLPFRNVVIMFSIFIFTCGLTHLMGIWTVWHGTYGLQGLVKGLTAAASVATAVALVPVMPRLMALRSPAELETANVALTREIKSRKKTEAQSRRFVEAAPDGIIIVDVDGRIRVLNQQAEVLFGYSQDELLGRSIELLVPNGSRNHHSELVEQYFNEPVPRPMGLARELYGVRSDGDEFPIEISLSAVGSPEEPLVSAAIRDISERRKLESQSRLLEQELAHVGRLDTMGQMAAGLAHELNQPLTAITQNADAANLMVKDMQTIHPELVATLKELEEQAHRAGEIIRALRGFVSKDDVSRSTFDLSELIEQTVRLLEAEAHKNDVTIALNINPMPKVVGARVQIAQVLVNLARNAIAAMRDSQTENAKLEIVANHTKDQLTIIVQDNGPGVSDDMVPFTPFETSKQDGMGLGLSISRAIIERHGGELWIDEKYSDGARFCISLPVETT